MAFGWDALGRLVLQTNPAGAVAASYDLAGRLTRLEWPDHAFVAYDHLATGETAKVRYNGATSGPDLLATYGYDSLGRRTGLTRGNGTSTSYAYDAVSRLAQMTHNLGGAATTHDLTLGFAYDPAGGIVSVTRSNDLYAWTKHGSGTTTTTANGRNQLASWNAPLSYNAKGNLTSDGINGFGYSSENLLTSLTVPPWGSVAMGYDPLMRFAASSEGQRFLRFGDALIGEYYQGALVSRFVPGADLDETLARLSGSGVRSWHYPDERGSTIAVAGDSGTATSLIAYDEYGRPGATEPPRIGYAGQPLLSFGLLYDYRNRTYHAGLGRFLQPDPIGYEAGLSLYAYVGGDPLNRIDPLGTGGTLDCNQWYCVWREDIEIQGGAPSTNAGYAALLRGTLGRGGGPQDRPGGGKRIPLVPAPGGLAKDPNPDPRRDACGNTLPPASRRYSIPPGYSGSPFDPNHQMVINSQGRNIMNPHYEAARQGGGINWRGVASDLGEIAFLVAVSQATGGFLRFTFGPERGAQISAMNRVNTSAEDAAARGIGGKCSR